ncbi:triphosphoribosyl-dephospho-CoA synthase MdcB [Duganella sp. Leaf126]|uniref:triphosphoribosyl-dephospho-CoA synthase n=1 Tax=Duganella sp. Leaf126 TaxID=1736266 RepID=UPI0006F7D67A|nr:triphosphoribosyl-dephospho-CoA synthase [Duganella sp. Leaf126]KQQ32493.1 triphosphoribosyl-dephospho-CoA synthase MdcB [Duganella sp. Leaf126]
MTGVSTTILSHRSADALAALAVAALVDEAMLTPKPGLVDLRGSGAHSDLSWLLMCDSAQALQPAFQAMAHAGATIADLPALRRRIGAIGRAGEALMMTATSGVNTHRGAIWALGLLVTAAAHRAAWPDAGGRAHDATLANGDGSVAVCSIEAGSIAARAGALARLDDPGAPATTGNKGEAARRTYGVGGARGQAEAAFPHVTGVALPVLRAARDRGDTEPAARINALLAVMADLDDTCLLARGGRPALAAAQAGARAVLAAGGAGAGAGRLALRALDAELLARRVSPGGAADLLAATLLLDRLDCPHRGTTTPPATEATYGTPAF